MTVMKGDVETGNPVDNNEPEISLPAVPATDGSIPMVEAVVVDSSMNSPPAFNPSFSATTTTTTAAAISATTVGNSSIQQQQQQRSQSENYQIQQDEELALRIHEQQQQSALQPPPPQVVAQPQPQVQPPPGLPPHGRWVLMQSIGPTTWTICTILSVIFCFFICLPCGLWAFLCPCDEERAYLVDGKLFNENGGMIGSARSRRYRSW